MTTGKRAFASAVVAVAALVSSGQVRAALYDRGNGLIYDDVLDVTWLQDVQYAQTSGYDSDGIFNWADSIAWADQLVYAGYDDWRLPTLTPVNGVAFNRTFSMDGSTDYAYNISYPGRISPPDPAGASAGFTGNELAHMYYVNLGNLAAAKPDPSFYDRGTWRSGTPLVDWGLINASFVDGATGETVTFLNLLGLDGIWTSHPAAEDYTFSFMYSGFNDSANTIQLLAAWAVRDGDVADEPNSPGPSAIDEPPTLLMLLAGFGVLGLLRRRIRRT